MSKKKSIKAPVLPTSRDLVPFGPRQVQTKHHGKRDENGLKPSTSRALVLRNGKYGARGTGELMFAGKMSGREKLDLLAEDLVLQKSRTAIMAPFKLEKCIRIADSQFNAYLDDIANLKDPDLFYDKITHELTARTPNGTSGGTESSQNPSYIASVVSTSIHNAYMVASGWKLVLDILRQLEKSGLKDATAQAQLQKDENLRSRYLVLCDILRVLVDLGQMHFSTIAMNTPHYSRYFKQAENVEPGEPSIVFDWGGLKEACRSFLDSIIIELCFPGAPYPKPILYHILHDAVDESPREAKRFPQAMWDAVGDLSVVLELLELLESPLLGPQGQKLETFPRQMPEVYELWLDAQIYSKQASESYSNFKDLISPLEKTKDRKLLDDMWKFINLNYKAVSGLSIDSLWQLDDALHRTPQWSSFYMPNLKAYGSDSDDEDSSKRLVKSTGRRRSGTGGKQPQKKLLAITDGRADEDDGANSMPELQSVSDSSDDTGDEDIFVSEDEDEDEEDEDESDYDDETDYESEDEEFYRAMLREAMDTAMAIPEFFDPQAAVPEFDALAEERKGNPFLKLLGSLRGRMFSSNPKLSSTTRDEPRKGVFPGKGHAAKAPPRPSAAPQPQAKAPTPPASKVPITRPTPPESKEKIPIPDPSEESKDYRATVEDADEEDETPSVTGKKKKKKKPKKKKKATSELPVVQEDIAPPSTQPPTKPQPSLTPESPAKSPSKAPVPSIPVKNPAAQMSTASLPIGTTTAQSGRSYLQEMAETKEKVKSRPNHASLFSDRRGFLTKLSGKDKDKDKKKADDQDEKVNKKFGWFSNLGKKTAGYMHQLLHPSGAKVGHLRWENFVKVMQDMGFKYDPSTAGSSVRFDPPDPKDRSISVHKPHPGSTMDPWKIRDIGNKLKNYYGWSEEDFLKRTSALAEPDPEL